MLHPWEPANLPWLLYKLQPWMGSHNMPMLLCHLNLVFLGWAASLALSYGTSFFGPMLFSKLYQRAKTPSFALNFSHRAVGLIHALFASFFSFYNMMFVPKSEEKLLGYSKQLGVQCGLTVGYFLWDLFATLNNYRYYGATFILHAIIGFFPLAGALSPIFLCHVPKFLLFEVSSIFLHSHWYMEKFGFGMNWMMINDMFLVVSFFVFRILFGWILIIEVLQDMTIYKAAMGHIFFLFLCFTFASALSLNHFWFYKIFRATLRHMKEETRHHHHHQHHPEEDNYQHHYVSERESKRGAQMRKRK
jgi:hypothetical protein